MAGGYITVIQGPGCWTVPAQAVEPDRATVARTRDTGNQRAAMNGREEAYRVARVTVEEEDGDG